MKSAATEESEMGTRTSDVGNPTDILITEASNSDARADLVDTLGAAMKELSSRCDLYDAIHAARSNQLTEDNALGAVKQVAKARGVAKFASWVESHSVDDQRELVIATLDAITAR